MNVIVCKNYVEMSKEAAKIIKYQIKNKPDSVMGFATGATPVGTYRCLIDMYNKGEVDFSKITSFNLDEYYPISKTDPQSYHYFMDINFFNHVNIDKSHVNIPDGEALDAELECAQYEEKIIAAGGIDLQILGIGRNGHIGFNEPDVNLNTKTHKTALAEDTKDANSRFFESGKVIEHALTMGISTILSSKKIIILASGKSKHSAISELLSDKITTNNPSTLLKVHPDVTLICDRDAYSDMSIGVDIGGMSVKLGVVDNNRIIDKKVVGVTKTSTSGDIVNDIVNVCDEFMAKYSISKIGVGVPGLITNGEVNSANLPFKGFKLAKELQEKLNIPVKVENDANCAALGESEAGAAKDVKNTILITLGTGIGGGIIINNKIYRGRGNAGEIGHLCLESGGKLCNCGKHGCWEQYASVSALIKLTEDAIKENPQSTLSKIATDSGGVNGETVFLGVEMGSEIAKAVLDSYITYLADGINSLISLFDPEMILLSGGLSNAGLQLLTPLKEKIKSSTYISLSMLKNDAGLIGAANL